MCCREEESRCVGCGLGVYATLPSERWFRTFVRGSWPSSSCGSGHLCVRRIAPFVASFGGLGWRWVAFDVPLLLLLSVVMGVSTCKGMTLDVAPPQYNFWLYAVRIDQLRLLMRSAMQSQNVLGPG